MELAQEKLDLLIDLLEADGWEKIKNEDGIMTEKIFLEGSDVACFRAMGIVNAKPVDLMEFIWDIYSSEEKMKKYSPDINSYEVFENLSPDIRLCYQINKLGWPIWSRDVAFLQTRISTDDDSYWIYMYSVDSDAKPICEDKYVRANINISAYGFVPEKDGTLVYRIAHVDPGGSIPVNVINSYGDKTAKMIKEMMNLYPNN